VITDRTMEQLRADRWPGNVRELRNMIERAAIVSTGGKPLVELGGATLIDPPPATGVRTEAQIQQAIRDNLVACLTETKGKVADPEGAAALLGIQATTLYSRIRKMNITAQELARSVPEHVPRPGLGLGCSASRQPVGSSPRKAPRARSGSGTCCR